MPNAASTENTDFSFEDLLISRTDKRGVIAAVNQPFQRISGYDWQELVNAPHKIVRHPDMPKAVFHLIWEKLGKGEPVGAYLKNQTKDGQHYWVLATIIALPDGFVSVRSRPSAAALNIIQPIYAKLLEQETEKSRTPAEGAQDLLGILSDQGFPSYEAFMAKQLSLETAHRNDHLKRPRDGRMDQLTNLTEEWPRVGKECQRVDQAYQEFDVAPLNMRIQAAQLNEAGIALGVISSNFAELAGNIHSELREIMLSVPKVAATIDDAVFLIGVQRLMGEAERVIAKETGKDAIDHQEIDVIRMVRRDYESKSRTGLQATSATLTQFLSMFSSIKRNLSGLSVTRVMSAIENAQVTDSNNNSISAIIDELRAFQELTDISLRTIQHHLSRFNTQLNQADTRDRPRRKAA